jgi:hypothetical protein
VTDRAPEAEDPFVEEVMSGVARQERRLPAVTAALAAVALVLALPAVVALKARPALEALLSLGRAAMGEAASAAVDNPAFWAGAAVAAGWLGWLAWRALGRGPR